MDALNQKRLRNSRPQTESGFRPATDHHKISFDGYMIGQKFVDKGYKRPPFVHKSPNEHIAEFNTINRLTNPNIGRRHNGGNTTRVFC